MKKLLLLFLGSLLFSQAFAQNNKPKPPIAVVQEEVNAYVEEQAEFPGGLQAFVKYMEKNVQYPQTAREANIEGKCYLRFVVEKDGSISKVEVARGVPGCPVCDKEAVRVIKAMPKWKPGKINGKNVRSYNDVPVSFILD